MPADFLASRHRLFTVSGVSSQQVRSSGVLCRWSDGLELTAWSLPGPNAQLWLFQVTPEDTLVFAVLDTQRIRGVA